MPLGQVPAVRWEQGFTKDVESHFGYANHSTLGDSLGVNTFMSMNMYRQSAVSQYPSLTLAGPGIWGRSDINENDINRLQQDPSVNIIYTTGDSEILFVTP